MKKYSDFISSKLNEGILKDLLGSAASFIRGDKQKLSTIISEMEAHEKKFLDQSDELNYSVFSSESQRKSDPVEMTAARQKGFMARRALEALKIAKSAEIKVLGNQATRICKKSADLIEFYNKEKAQADSRIAQYAYEKSKRFKDYSYEEQFYNHWRELDDQAQKVRNKPNFSDQDFSYDDYDQYTMGMFDKPLNGFMEDVNSLPKKELAKLLEDGQMMKVEFDAKHKEKIMYLKSLKTKAYRGGDIPSYKISEEQINKLNDAHKKASLDLNNKLSILKMKVKRTIQ
jgi:hypothetical protein